MEFKVAREVARLTTPEYCRYAPSCFTPDGARLIATSYTKTVFVWDLRRLGEQLHELWPEQEWLRFPHVKGPRQRLRRVEVLGASRMHAAAKPMADRGR